MLLSSLVYPLVDFGGLPWRASGESLQGRVGAGVQRRPRPSRDPLHAPAVRSYSPVVPFSLFVVLGSLIK